MSSEGSVTRWLSSLQSGDLAGAQPLWERFFPRLVGLARTKLQGARARAADEEDVALSAFDSFCRHAQAGRFPQLADRDGLWRLLVTITTRKVVHLLRSEGAQKRGGSMTAMNPTDDTNALDHLPSQDPSPELAAQLAEEFQRLLRLLGSPELESVALWRMEGYSLEEIAARLGYAPRSVKRKLQLIRDLWEKEVTDA
jgi:DNA-directed RNA polymerase specialized sigma24 family protein